jgi:hypothetical protein
VRGDVSLPCAACIERWLVVLIAIHSAAIGLGALLAPEWGLRFGGFGSATPLFFPRQVGLFHILVAVAYLIEHRRYGGITILLTAKGLAVLFLTTAMLLDDLPWVVPFSAAGDAAMGLAIWFVRRAAETSRRSVAE